MIQQPPAYLLLNMKHRLTLVLSLFLLISGCAGGGVFGDDERESPVKSANAYYKMLMWKYHDRASAFVHPHHRAEFDTYFLENRDNLNITSYQISEVVTGNDSPADEMIVRVYVTYYKYPSVSEKSEMISDIWVMQGKAWFVKPDFTSDMYQ